MTGFTPNQLEYQQRILASLDLDPGLLDGQQSAWWFNPTNLHSLRLTRLGHKWFRDVANIACYPVSIGDQRILPRQLLQLERLWTAPYYIQTSSKIWVYNETDYVMLQLHGHNLHQYLNNLQLK